MNGYAFYGFTKMGTRITYRPQIIFKDKYTYHTQMLQVIQLRRKDSDHSSCL